MEGGAGMDELEDEMEERDPSNMELIDEDSDENDEAKEPPVELQLKPIDFVYSNLVWVPSPVSEMDLNA